MNGSILNKQTDNNLWVSMSIIRNIVLGAAKNKEHLEMICAAGDIESTWLDKAEKKITLAQNCAIMEAAIHFSEDPSLGLHIGERTTPVVLGLTGHLMESSPNVLSALKHLQEFTYSFTRLYSFYMEIKDHELHYYCEPIEIWNQISPETARHSVDIAFAGAINFILLLTGKKVFPIRINYRYSRPSAQTEHSKILNVQPLFNQPINSIVFDLQDMHLPLIGFNQQLNTAIRGLLESEYKKSAMLATFSDEVKQLLLKHFQNNIPQLEEIAELMSITPRTLQRKLQEESTSFRKISEQIRMELAIELLNNIRLSISEIAYLLGYNDPTAFQRAFRQWTNTTPQAYRTKKST